MRADELSLDGRVAVVTGRAAGIGRATAEALAAHGATVAVLDIDESGMGDLVGAGIEAHPVDVRDPAALGEAIDELVDSHGRLDVLVNNVGHYLHAGADFVDTGPEAWHEAFDLNLWPVLHGCRSALPAMIAGERGGSIVNLTTVEAHRGKPQHAVYAAAKAAVAHFSTSLALEVGQHGIRVNCVAPDVVRSRQLPYERWLTADDVARIPTWVPLGRLGEPDDVAGVVLFLASDLSRFVTGTTILADGGTRAAGGWFRSNRPGREWTNRPHEP